MPDSTFEMLTAGRDADYPILCRAAKDVRPSGTVRIEWIVDDLNDGHTSTILFNHNQIFRARRGSHPKRSVDEAAHVAAEEMLANLNFALKYGVPWRESFVATLGGYWHFLHRRLNSNDILRLRPLREPFLRIIEQDEFGHHLDYPIAEWICETSLEVIPQAP
jgi:hypothetical protein